MSETKSQTRGCYIVLEGDEGCGKTTQVKRLCERLKQAGFVAEYVREPGSVAVGEKLREILLDPGTSLDPVTELHLFLAGRAQLLTEKVRPMLEDGVWVLSDRSTTSTYVYQGLGRQLDVLPNTHGLAAPAGNSVFREVVNSVARLAPVDLTIVLDIPLEISLERTRGREMASGVQADRFELESLGFRRRINDGYRQAAKFLPTAVGFVDGIGTLGEVDDRIWSMLTDWAISQHKFPGTSQRRLWDMGKPFYEGNEA